MKKIFLLCIFVALAKVGFSQPLSSYGFTAFSSPYTAIAGTTAPISGGSTVDDAYSNGIPIGFNFTYCSVVYTTVSASWNGWLTLGTSIGSSVTWVPDLTNSSAYNNPRPILAALWTDLYYSSGTQLSYATTGVAPNRVFTMQWNNAGYYSTTTPRMSFQIILYETTNIIDFAYKNISTGTYSDQMSIGITSGSGAAVTGAVQAWSLNNTSAAPVPALTSGTGTLLSTQPATNQVYRWSACNPGTITGTATVCVGSTTTLGNAVTGGTWASSVPTIAAITGTTGIVTGVAPGTTTITYTPPASTGCYTVSVVTVNPLPAAITGTTNVCTGLTTTLSDASGPGTWVSGSVGVATVVAGSGVVTGVTAGTSNITFTITATGCQTVTPVTVYTSPSAISGTSTMCVGLTTSLTDGISGGTWASSSGVATVSATGVVTGVSAGSATITYTLTGGCKATLPVTVNSLPGAISGSGSVCTGYTITLSDATPAGTWASSTPTVASVVAGTGVVTGIAAGTATLTYTLGTGCIMTTVITVNTTPATITSASGFAICNGSSITLGDATPGVTWTSGTTSVATVTPTTGVVTTGGATGTSVITATLGTCTATATVTVNTQPVPIAGTFSVCETFSSTLTDATPGGAWTVVAGSGTAAVTGGVVTGGTAGTVTISYAIGTCVVTSIFTVNTQPAAITSPSGFALCNGSSVSLGETTPGVSWTSGNTGVATITPSTGVVTGVGVGTSIITTTLGSCYDTAVITVNTQPLAIAGTFSVCQTFTTALTDPTTGGSWSVVAGSGTAAITSAGVLTGGTAGTVTVSYTIGSCYVTQVVTVATQPAAITGSLSICDGSTSTLTETTPGVTWSSSNTGVATVSGTGVVTSLSVGTSTITTIIGSCFATAVVTVNTEPAPISGGTYTVCQTFTVSLFDGTTGGTWSVVPGTGTATVSATGVVTGGNAGTVTVSYTIGTCAVTQVVTINTQPAVITDAAGFSVCALSTTTLTETTPGVTWTSGNTSVATVSGTGVVTGVAAGTSVITTALAGCMAFATVTVNTQPVAIGGTLEVCSGLTTPLSDGTAGGMWSVVAGTGTAIISSTGVVTGGTAGTVTISYMIGTCGVAAILTIDPLPATIASPGAICVGATATLTDPTPLGTWTSSNTGIATIGAGTGIVTGVAFGSVSITYKLPTGCIITSTLVINPLPTVITGIDSVCLGLTTSLFNGTPGGTWSSSNGNATIAASSSGVVTGSIVGTSIITYSLGTGCQQTIVVTVNPLPAAITGPVAVCVGSTITVADGTPLGTWSSSNTGLATITAGGVVTGQSAGAVNITYKLPTGCIMTYPITVNGLPPGVTGSHTVCPTTTVTLNDGTPGGTWSSSNTGFASVDPTSGVVMGIAAGTLNITYTLGTGCYVTFPMTVNPAPVPLITPLEDTTFCPGGFTALTANIGAGLSYQWYVGGGSITGAMASSYIATNSGSYQVMETNTFGCSTLSIPMQVLADTPHAVITVGGSGATLICAGSTITLDANVGVGLSYQWLLGGAPISGAGASSYSTTVPGVYAVVVTNATGCSSVSATVTVSTNPSPTVNVTLSGPLVFCQGSDLILTTGIGTGYTYQWYNSGAAIVGGTNYSYTATASGGYSVNVTNTYGCTVGSILTNVTVNPSPNVAITPGGPLLFCSGGSVTLSATAVLGFTYQWFEGGTAIAGATNATYVATATGGYQVQITDPTTGCTGETLVDTNVTEISTPVISPLTPTSFCWGSSALLGTSVTSTGGVTVTYQWMLNGVNIAGATSSSYNAVIPGNYSVQIIIPGSCTMTTMSVPVTEFPLPNPPITFDGTYFHTTNTYISYQWYEDLIAIPGATTDYTPAISNGNYKVQVTDVNGCQSFSDIYVLAGWVGNPISLQVQSVNQTEVRIYPNPAQTMVHVVAAVPVQAVISGIDGRAIIDQKDAKDIDITGLADGIYMISVYDITGHMLKVEKLVKTTN